MEVSERGAREDAVVREHCLDLEASELEHFAAEPSHAHRLAREKALAEQLRIRWWPANHLNAEAARDGNGVAHVVEVAVAKEDGVGALDLVGHEADRARARASVVVGVEEDDLTLVGELVIGSSEETQQHAVIVVRHRSAGGSRHEARARAGVFVGIVGAGRRGQCQGQHRDECESDVHVCSGFEDSLRAQRRPALA